MSRQIRFMVLICILVLVTLACNAVTQPFNQVKETVATVETFATAMPVETLMAIPSMLPSEMPNLDMTSVPGFDTTSMPNVPDMFNPKSKPLQDWKDIPVMPDAIAGDESNDAYVYTIKTTTKAVQAYYDDQLSKLGWKAFSGMGENTQGMLLIYQKDSGMITILVSPTATEGVLLVMLTKG